MSSHAKPPTTKQRLDLAFKALCDISFLGVDADGQDARRIAQEALQAMQMDMVQIVHVQSEGRFIATSAAGNQASERAQLELTQQMIAAIIERDGGRIEFSEIVMVDDHPKPKGE